MRCALDYDPVCCASGRSATRRTQAATSYGVFCLGRFFRSRPPHIMCQSTITWSLPSASEEGSIEFTHPEKPVRGGNAFALLADVACLSELARPWPAALGVMPPLHVLADLASYECHDGMGRSQRRCALLNTHIRSTRIALDDAGLMHTSSPHTSYNKLETLCEEDEEEAEVEEVDEVEGVEAGLEAAARRRRKYTGPTSSTVRCLLPHCI